MQQRFSMSDDFWAALNFLRNSFHQKLHLENPTVYVCMYVCMYVYIYIYIYIYLQRERERERDLTTYYYDT